MQETEYYNEIKDLIINNEVNKKVKSYSINRTDLETKYNIGKLLSEAGKHYGESIIKNYSIKLTQEFGKGYSERSLRNIRQFYNFIEANPKWQALPAKLTYSHYVEVIWINDNNIIDYYLNKAINNNISYRNLSNLIKSKEYERLPEDTKNKLINNEALDISDIIPEPILIPNTFNKDKEHIKEKELQSIIVENIEDFMKQLGDGYCYIDSEYKIKIGNNYNYIDILLFNIEYNCYVTVELKVTELKKEHIGQIQTYMNYINENIKKSFHNNTIGIIICKENNNYIIKYSSDDRILTRQYILK